MRYCIRCWDLKGIKKKTDLLMELGKGECEYFCLGCLNEMEEPMSPWLFIIFPLFLAFWSFLFYKAGEQAGRKNS
jgi:hypothetical protein